MNWIKAEIAEVDFEKWNWMPERNGTEIKLQWFNEVWWSEIRNGLNEWAANENWSGDRSTAKKERWRLPAAVN